MVKSPAPLILHVAVPAPLPRHFDYLPPEHVDTATLAPGMRLRVPFGKREIIGVLLATSTHSDVPAAKLKRASALLDETPLIPADLLALARWAADYYHHPIGEVVAALLPPMLRTGESGVAALTYVWRLTAAGSAADMLLLKRAPKQAALLRLLVQHAGGMESAALDAALAHWQPPMRALLRHAWVEKISRVPPSTPASVPVTAGLNLNAAQGAAAQKIQAALGQFQAFLLDGVTGSGKTEVYLEVMAECVRRGGQALLLVPEIGLTPQLLQRVRRRFPAAVVFHSALAAGERLAAWQAARTGLAPVVVGTRSAVFLPLKHPGLIVVDEEHDASFKQQDGFRYSARDLAVVRAARHHVPVVLGSATPSLESLHNCAQLRYAHLSLPERAGVAQHPQLRLLDIRDRPMEDGLSDLLLDAMRRHLQAEGQVLLFLNRRGYAPTVMCHVCGATLQCRRCDARLTLHANRRLQCHHCGAERSLPARCEECGAGALGQYGYGTERIERALARLFPDTGIARLDRDSIRRKGKLEALLDGMQRGEFPILVGTQMLAKGHDFPGVTLVGIVDADQGLFGVDFRASERMAQLIMQVAGRAGRAARHGEVLIQTHHPDHPLLTHLVREGYASFAQALLAERRAAGLPPYAAMALLRAEAVARAAPMAFLEAARRKLAPACGRQVQLLGPAPAPMERRAGRYRAQLLLIAAQRALLQQALATALPALYALKQARRVRWSLDVDPAETL
ncbi:MAG TPA: primosomal protein N' [Gammaproteobacteria bacterium]|nr:primosomal protein N' [Gammaproteobacteria bacterium]